MVLRHHIAASIACIATLAATPAIAAVYKCKQGTQIVYSDKPCPDAQVVDTTNGKPPTRLDQLNAQMRSNVDKLSIEQQAAQKELDRIKSARCAQMARDHNWTQSRAAKYINDPWWLNRTTESADKLNRECSDYLIPQGAR